MRAAVWAEDVRLATTRRRSFHRFQQDITSMVIDGRHHDTRRLIESNLRAISHV